MKKYLLTLGVLVSTAYAMDNPLVLKVVPFENKSNSEQKPVVTEDNKPSQFRFLNKEMGATLLKATCDAAILGTIFFPRVNSLARSWGLSSHQVAGVVYGLPLLASLGYQYSKGNLFLNYSKKLESITRDVLLGGTAALLGYTGLMVTRPDQLAAVGAFVVGAKKYSTAIHTLLFSPKVVASN